MSDLLRPLSFEKLMALLLEERSADGTIFGVKDIYKAGRSRLPIFGLRIENPVGPAAGPVTQTAQGIIAAYAAGARFFELKTVFPEPEPAEKPSASIGDRTFSSEHPSELSLGDAFGEYVKAWYAIKLISTAFELGVPEGFIFNMSVGGSLNPPNTLRFGASAKTGRAPTWTSLTALTIHIFPT